MDEMEVEIGEALQSRCLRLTIFPPSCLAFQLTEQINWARLSLYFSFFSSGLDICIGYLFCLLMESEDNPVLILASY